MAAVLDRRTRLTAQGQVGAAHAMLREAAAEHELRLGLYVRISNFKAVNAYLQAGFRIVVSVADQYSMEIKVPLNATTGAP